MHELSIAYNIMYIAREEAMKAAKDCRINKVTVNIGRFASIVPSILRQHFTAVTKGTDLEGSTLEIKEIPLVLKCGACSMEFTLDKIDFSCPGCSGKDLVIRSGRDLSIESIEIEDGN